MSRAVIFSGEGEGFSVRSANRRIHSMYSNLNRELSDAVPKGDQLTTHLPGTCSVTKACVSSRPT